MLALVVVLAASSCVSSTPEHTTTVVTTVSPTSRPTSTTPTSRAPTTTAPTGKPVKVSSTIGDGETVGVGMPIVLSFRPSPTDSAAFTKAAKVTVNGQPANGAWYWEKPYADQPIQAHYRQRGLNFWPAHATIKVNLPIKGLSAGKGLVYAGGLTSVTFQTGDKHLSIVDGAAETMKVTSNGTLVKTLKVSLGKAQTPTYLGYKVVMQKGEAGPSGSLRPDGTVRMIGPNYNELVPWSVRMTADGEYVHDAHWNHRIGEVSTSNGCTNLTPADSKWFYGFARKGDVVQYLNTGGDVMPPLQGLGDWNVPWGAWSQGGLLLNH